MTIAIAHAIGPELFAGEEFLRVAIVRAGGLGYGA